MLGNFESEQQVILMQVQGQYLRLKWGFGNLGYVCLNVIIEGGYINCKELALA